MHSEPPGATKTESEAFRLDEHLALLRIEIHRNPVPNPIQIQFGTFFMGYDNGWTFPYNSLEEHP
jgi:hypothetical protein